MKTIDTYLTAIRTEVLKRGLSNHGLALCAGLHRNTLRHLHLPTWSPSVDTLRKLEAYLFCNLPMK